MSADLIIKRAIQASLERAEKSGNLTGDLKVSFRSKKLLQDLNVDISFLADEVYISLKTLKFTKYWVSSVSPSSEDRVDGVKSLSLVVSLSYFDEIARYCDYERQDDRPDAQWQKVIQDNNLPFHNFKWRHWGESPESAVTNIQKCFKLLSTDRVSRHQISSHISLNAKQLSQSDIDDLLSMDERLRENLRPRKVILNYHCVSTPNECLIVENMDTYHYLQDHVPPGWMLVCGFGNRVNKSDIDNLEVVDLHSSTGTPGHIKAECNDFWASKEHQKLYWGDLDDTGMAIFESLKLKFPELSLWRPAYSLMKRLQSENHGIDVHQESILISDMSDPWL